MKIIDKRKSELVPFGDINVGELFLDGDCLLLKTIESLEPTDCDYNAVSLHNGQLTTYGVNVHVKPVDGEVSYY